MRPEVLIRMVLGVRPDKSVPHVPTREETDAALSILSPRTALVLERRSEGRTLQSIGEAIGLSRERVRQLEAEALKRLRHPGNLWRLGVVRDPETGRTIRRPEGARPEWTERGWVLSKGHSDGT